MKTKDDLSLTAPGSLLEARLQAHHAAQLVAAVGATLLEPAADDSHPNLGWSRELQALVGRAVPRAAGLRAAIRLADLHVLLLDSQQAQVGELTLEGLTLATGYKSLSDLLAERAKQPGLEILPTSYELPSHDLEQGAKFGGLSAPALASLGTWYDLASELLEESREQNSGASEVRCWPHHFDLATLISLEGEKSIGVGFSPGDGSYAEPYWYVSPWPYPAESELPALPHGHWQTEGFTAAILTASQMGAQIGPEDPASVSRSFLRGAVHASQQALKSV